MSDGQILDVVHADDAVEGSHLDVVLGLFFCGGSRGGNLVFVHQVNNLLLSKRAVAEEVVEVGLSLALVDR
jgi:hypothetical protein